MDPIANMLTQIRNAQAVGKETVKVPFSKLKFELVKLLIKEGYLTDVERRGKKINKTLEVVLKYLPIENSQIKTPAITNVRRISKPGRRMYAAFKDIKPVMQGLGIAIISTSVGLLTSREAVKKKLGGEIICELW